MKLQGYTYSNHTPVEITLENELIKSIEHCDSISNQPIIGPGLTDIQVNGFGGIDYNEVHEDLSVPATITKLLFQQGVTTHFPTVITNSVARISKLVKQLVSLRKQDVLAQQSIEGIHIEGPFISAQDGPRGAHPKEFIRPPEWELVVRWLDESEGLLKLITVSPEWENTNLLIEQCVKNNIVVAIGHTCATHQQLNDAVSAGATLSTHLGNGMHPILPRHPNYLWSQLADDRLHASIIADGFHLPPEVIHVFKKVKNDKLILISDSVSLAGMAPGDYDLHIGGHVTLTKEGKLHLRNNPSIFAGSASSLLQGISFLIKNKLANEQEAWEMASVRPQKIILNNNI